MTEDAVIAAEEIVYGARFRAQFNPLLQWRYHMARPSSWRGVRNGWALTPDAEKERMIVLAAQLTGLVIAVIIERWTGGDT